MIINKLKTVLRQTTLFVLSLVLLTSYPAAALADTLPPTTDPSTTTSSSPSDPTNTSSITPAPAPTPDPSPAPVPPPAPPTTSTGPTQPSGAASSTYMYNPSTGLWENDFFTWNPVTKQTSPKTTQTYSYNPTTGRWDTVNWVYDAAAGKYVPNVVEVTAPPAGALLLNSPLSAAGINNTGPDSTSNLSNSNNFNGVFNGFYNASISNNLSQLAQTGDASVTFNTLGGNAASGNAQDVAKVINALQSSIGGLQGNNLTTFTMNINGNINGDILLNPSNLGPGSNTTADSQTNNTLTVNNQASGVINNDINLAAASGNATIASNTTGGNATSGNAAVLAGITNIVNSVVGAGKSFVGVININGNLNGDILLPQDALNSLIASSGPYATVDLSSVNNAALNANVTNNQSIHNNITGTATTGNAAVSSNTTGGNATTGNASNKVNVLNLTGSTIIGKDCLLVFVNVLGNWVGMLVNSPTGSTAAALGGNLTTNSTNNATANLNSTTNQAINNNINVSAASGNAGVTKNTTGGNATTGNASTSVDLTNIEGSTLNLSDWLGILFINVFGSWSGSFGVNTSAGDPVGGKGGGGPAGAVQNVKVFQFVPQGNTTAFAKVNSQVLSAVAGNSAVNDHQAKFLLGKTTGTSPPTGTQAANDSFTIIAAGIGILGFAWLFSTTAAARKGWSKRTIATKPIGSALHAVGTRLLTFLF